MYYSFPFDHIKTFYDRLRLKANSITRGFQPLENTFDFFHV